jgi:hypothetical protein
VVDEQAAKAMNETLTNPVLEQQLQAEVVSILSVITHSAVHPIPTL